MSVAGSKVERLDTVVSRLSSPIALVLLSRLSRVVTPEESAAALLIVALMLSANSLPIVPALVRALVATAQTAVAMSAAVGIVLVIVRVPAAQTLVAVLAGRPLSCVSRLAEARPIAERRVAAVMMAVPVVASTATPEATEDAAGTAQVPARLPEL